MKKIIVFLGISSIATLSNAQILLPEKMPISIGGGYLCEKTKSFSSEWQHEHVIFDKDYKPMLPYRDEELVILNKLPKTPSTEDVEKDKIDAAEWNATLTKKIEELMKVNIGVSQKNKKYKN